MTLKGKKKGTVLRKFARRDRSKLETAPHKHVEIPSGIILSQKRMGNIPKHRCFGEHVVTCLLEVDCFCWGMGVGAQDHSWPHHKDIRCEWEAYPWHKSPGNNSRYNKYLLEALVYSISSSFGEKRFDKVSCVFQLLVLPDLLEHSTNVHYIQSINTKVLLLTCWIGIVDCWKKK